MTVQRRRSGEASRNRDPGEDLHACHKRSDRRLLVGVVLKSVLLKGRNAIPAGSPIRSGIRRLERYIDARPFYSVASSTGRGWIYPAGCRQSGLPAGRVSYFGRRHI